MVYHLPETNPSSYDNESGNMNESLPDLDFAMDDDKEFVIGQVRLDGL